MKQLILYTTIVLLASSCGQVKSTSDANELDPTNFTVTETYTEGEKIYYRLSEDTRVRATVIKKINDRRYLITIYQNSKGVRRKVSVNSMEKVD